MKFAHLADVHIGAWRDPAMKSLALQSLRESANIILGKNVDFVIIAGDLFNTALPAIDHLQETVVLLKKFKDKNIPVYVIPGSHDYSAAGKTIIDVLAEADLLVMVMKGAVVNDKLILKFTKDEKTGLKLAGLGGRRGSLDHKEYRSLDLQHLESEPGKKIFLFHTSIDELKPDEMYAMLSVSIETFPKNFYYYAGGHVHVVQKEDFPERKNVIYPGPIFPANFQELWNLGRGGFFIVEDDKIEHIPVNVKNVQKLELNCESKSAEEAGLDLEAKMKSKDLKDAIVMIRAHGKLRSGRASDINFKLATQEAYSKGAYFVMRSTTKLTSQEFTEVKPSSASAEELEDEIIHNHLPKSSPFKEGQAEKIKDLIQAFSGEQIDGEKKYEYDSRMLKEADAIFGRQ